MSEVFLFFRKNPSPGMDTNDGDGFIDVIDEDIPHVDARWIDGHTGSDPREVGVSLRESVAGAPGPERIFRKATVGHPSLAYDGGIVLAADCPCFGQQRPVTLGA